MRWVHQPETDEYWESWKLYTESDKLVALIVEKYHGFEVIDFLGKEYFPLFESFTLAKEKAEALGVTARLEGKI